MLLPQTGKHKKCQRHEGERLLGLAIRKTLSRRPENIVSIVWWCFSMKPNNKDLRSEL